MILESRKSTPTALKVIAMSVANAAPVIPHTGISTISRRTFAMHAMTITKKASFGRSRAFRLIVPRFMKILTTCTINRKNRADFPSVKEAP